MEELYLTEEQTQEIKKKAEAIKKSKNISKVIPIVIFGDSDDSKDMYVGYFKKPDLMAYSKFMSFAKKDEVKAMKVLANDCFIEGDKDLVDNDDVFLHGTMAQLSVLLEARKGTIVNF